MDIYDRVTKLLKEQNISRRQMAEDIDVSYNTLNSLFRRKSDRIKLDIVQAMAKYLGTTSDFLAFGKEFKISNVDALTIVYNKLDPDKQKQLLKFAEFLAESKNE